MTDQRAEERVRRAGLGIPVHPTRAITASETLRESDGILEVATAGGAVTLTLPGAKVMKGRLLAVIKSDASANNVTLSSSDNVNGAGTLSWNTQYQVKWVTSNGSTYYAW